MPRPGPPQGPDRGRGRTRLLVSQRRLVERRGRGRGRPAGEELRLDLRQRQRPAGRGRQVAGPRAGRAEGRGGAVRVGGRERGRADGAGGVADRPAGQVAAGVHAVGAVTDRARARGRPAGDPAAAAAAAAGGKDAVAVEAWNDTGQSENHLKPLYSIFRQMHGIL